MSTSITTSMMNTPLANLARKSAIKTDPGSAPPPPDFRDDTSFDDAFSLDGASDTDSGDIQQIKPAAVKPTPDLKNIEHHNSLPIKLTCTTAAQGGAATGAQDGEGEDDAEDDLHDH
eukprot:jgi/Tetstr1/429942/TSEL_019805.t1